MDLLRSLNTRFAIPRRDCFYPLNNNSSVYFCVSQKHFHPGFYLDIFRELDGTISNQAGLLSRGTLAFHCLPSLLCLLLRLDFLFPVTSELFNRLSFFLIGCGLAFGTQINAC